MSIPIHNIAYYHGDTYKMVAEFYHADGSTISLLPNELNAYIVSDPDSPTTSYVTEFDITVSSSSATLSILPAMSAALLPGNTYYYDVEYSKTPAAGQPVKERYTFFKGAITVEGDITHVGP